MPTSFAPNRATPNTGPFRMSPSSRTPSIPADAQGANAGQQFDDNDQGIDLLGIVGALIDHKWLVASIVAIVTFAGWGYAELQTPIYRADALLLAETKTNNLPGMADFASIPSSTEVELLKSRTVISRAVTGLDLDLQVRAVRAPIVGAWFARRFERSRPGELAPARFGLEGYAWGGERLDLHRFEVPAEMRGRSFVVEVLADDGFRLFDGELLLGDGFVGGDVLAGGVSLSVRAMRAHPGTRFVVRRAPELEAIRAIQSRLAIAERGKQTGVLEMSILDSDPGRAIRVLDEIARIFVVQNVERRSAEAASRLEFLRSQLPKAREDMESADAMLNAFQARANSINISVEAQNLLTRVVQIDNRLSELQLLRAELDRKLKPDHPRYQAVLTQAAELGKQRDALTSDVRSLPETQQELLRLSRDAQVSTKIYTRLIEIAQELELARAGIVGSVQVVDPAISSGGPVEPKKARLILVAIVLGVVLALGLVLLLRLLNRSIENPDEIEKLGIPVYATVPQSPQQRVIEEAARRAARGGVGPAPILAVSAGADPAIESLRSLRTGLHFAMIDAPDNRIMISGPSPDVGKTFVATNLAGIHAQAGQRVLVIDADLRKGHLHWMLGGGSERGLSNLLAGDCSFDDAVRATALPGLHFIPRGQIPPNPSELLMRADLPAILKLASERFDLVIIDTPPLLAVTDAAIVGRYVGTSLLVARFGMNALREVELTLRRFAQNGIPIKGAVLNGIQRRASRYGYGYGYGRYGYYQYEYKADRK
ncbi:polysaccharide biosynthesis tyrosine autokinase [Thauera mechernichensis]